MKVVLNLIILISIGFGVFWNLQEDPIKKESNNIKIVLKSKIAKILNHEENLKLAKDLKLAEKIISKIDKTKLGELQTIIQGDIRIEYEIASEEAFWTVEANWFPYSIIVFNKNEVVLQFNGHLNKNTTPFQFEDLDIVAFRQGNWQNDL